MIRKSLVSSAVVAAGLVFVALPAGAADPTAEISTAAAHAGMAASSGDLKMVHAHLHHVINCLVGPGAADFDAAAANPCKGQGMGAIPDSPADKQASLGAAVATAKQGLAQTDLAKAKGEAMAVQATLKKAM
ncbi:MAG: hypothetical protein HY985_04470 [Magnetospirillum sp.]|nr:hypothetical protein [Magnetospirillum sp.]